ncbi:jg19552 [Pararge aegeria aegeria]|uniref:Jg19552 protein n=1 Tax=Pararge aegeria aegeria TaxID=348720 RepID=A0A8S4RDF0_9NEOP|nr:jg19552 [Pararge aegeria aegeria]
MGQKALANAECNLLRKVSSSPLPRFPAGDNGAGVRSRTCLRAAMRTSASPRHGNGHEQVANWRPSAQCARSLAAGGSVQSARTHAREPRACSLRLACEVSS